MLMFSPIVKVEEDGLQRLKLKNVGTKSTSLFFIFNSLLIIPQKAKNVNRFQPLNY
jgi:hypothetical protein